MGNQYAPRTICEHAKLRKHVIVPPPFFWERTVPSVPLVAAAETHSSLWCPDISHCSNLPSSAAPLHRAAAHNAQMVAIVLPGPLPRSVEQEALLCMPKGQEVWLTAAEPGERHTKTHAFVTRLSGRSLCFIVCFKMWQTSHYSSGSVRRGSQRGRCVCVCADIRLG